MNVLEKIEKLERRLAELRKEVQSRKYEKWDFGKHMQGFLDGNIVVNLPTEEVCERFVSALDTLGVKWNSGGKASEYEFGDRYQEHSCVHHEDSLTFGSCSYFEECDRKIVVFE